MRSGTGALSTSSPTSKLLGTGSIYLIGSLAPVLTGLLVTPFVTRSLGSEEYGIVALGASVYQLAALLVALGLPAAITRDAVLGEGGAPQAARLVLVGSAVGLAAALALSAASPLWRPLVAPEMPAPLPALSVASAWGIAMTTMALAYLRGVQRPWSFVALAAVLAIVPPGAALAAVTVSGPSAGVFVAVLAAGHCGAGLVGIVAVSRESRSGSTWPRLIHGLRLGLPTVPHQLAMVAATALVVVFAGRLGGRDAAAGTSVAVLIGSVPILLMSAFNNAWAPMVYRAQADERPRLIASTSVAMSTAAGALAIGVSLLAPVGLAILAPQSFGTSSALVTVVVIASAAPFMVPYLARIHLIFVRGDTRALAVATPVAVALSHLGALAAYGSLGAGNMWTLALALPVFYAIQAFFAHWMTRGDATDGLSLAIPWAIAGFAAAASCVTLLLPDAVSIRVVVAVSLVVLAVPITLAVQRRRGR